MILPRRLGGNEGEKKTPDKSQVVSNVFEASATPRTSGGLKQTPGIKVRKMKSAGRARQTPTTFNDDCMQIASMSVGYLHASDRGGNFSLTPLFRNFSRLA